MSIESILNYVSISDALASSGQPDVHQFDSIAKAGFRVVINLAMPDSDNAIADEGRIVESLGMHYVSIPVPFEAPSSLHLKEFFNIMQKFSTDKVWVHCALNYRVSAFLYQYFRIVHGMAEEDASKVMLLSWEPDETWQAFMQVTDL